MYSNVWLDSNAVNTGLMQANDPQTITVNASGGAATLSAAISRNVVRLTATVPTFLLFTTAGAVTSTTGHYLPANLPMPFVVTGGATKVSVLGVSGAGVCYLSELG